MENPETSQKKFSKTSDHEKKIVNNPFSKKADEKRIYNSYVEEMRRHIQVSRKQIIKHRAQTDIWNAILEAIQEMYRAEGVNLKHINSIVNIRNFPFMVKRYRENALVTLQYRNPSKDQKAMQENVYSLTFELRPGIFKKTTYKVFFIDHVIFYRTLHGLKDNAVKFSYKKNAKYNAKKFFTILQKKLAN